MRQHQAPFSQRHPTHRRRLILACLVMAAAISVLAVVVPGGDVGSVSAQVSPLSPLGVPAISDGPPLSLSRLPMVNVVASGQAGLTRLALLLLSIIVGVSVVIWRRP